MIPKTTILLPNPPDLYAQVLLASKGMREGASREVSSFSGTSPYAAYEVGVAGKRFRVTPGKSSGKQTLTRTF